MDNWKHRSTGMKCGTCMYFVVKKRIRPLIAQDEMKIGRCRRNAPRMNGWPVVYETDWCGEHKIDEEEA
jgi:hypothetical protein